MKPNIVYHICTCIVGLVLYSCMSNSQPESGHAEKHVIPVDFSQTSDTLLFSCFIDSVESKYLVLPDSLFIGEATQIYLDSTDIFVVDRKLKRVFHFDRNGLFVNPIDRLGEGPEEYLQISNFWVHKKELYIEDNRSLKINIYAFNGEYQRSIRYEKRFSNITMVSDSLFLCFTPYFIYDNPVGVWTMGTDGKLKEELVSYNTSYPLVSLFWKYFYKTSKEETGLFSPVTNSFMTYHTDSLTTDIQMDCAQHTAAAFPGVSDCWQVKEDFYTQGWFIDGTDWLLSCFGRFQGNEAFYLLYSKTKKKVRIFRSINVDVGNVHQLGMPICSNLPNSLVTLIADDDFHDENKLEHAIDGKSLLLIQIYRMKTGV